MSELFRRRITTNPTTVTDLQLLLLTEALLGAAATVEAVLQATERATPDELRAANAAAASQTHYLGWGLLRVPENQAAEARGRLGAICQRVGSNAANK